MEGSWMSGSMLATNRSVLETWLAVHIATTDSGANTHPKTMRTMATGVRQLNRRPAARSVWRSGWRSPVRPAPGRSAASISSVPGSPPAGSAGSSPLPASRPEASLSCGAGVSVVMDFPRLVRAAGLLASDDVTSVHHRAWLATSPRRDELSRRYRSPPGDRLIVNSCSPGDEQFAAAVHDGQSGAPRRWAG